MNVRTALISSALLLAVLGWACGQQGPASPSALGSPGGSSLGGVSLDAAGGAIVGVKPDCPDPDDHRCKPEEPTENPTYTVKVTGDIFSVGGVDGLYETNHPSGSFTVTDIHKTDISFIWDEVTCGREPRLPTVLTGSFSLTPFMIPSLLQNFEHNGAGHWFEALSILPVPWPPTVPNVPVTVTDKNGEWVVATKGKNHRDGCTGAGGPGNNPIDWTATVTLLP